MLDALGVDDLAGRGDQPLPLAFIFPAGTFPPTSRV